LTGDKRASPRRALPRAAANVIGTARRTSLGLALRADQRRVARVHDDHVAQPDRAHEVLGLRADDDVVVAVDQHHVAGVDRVVLLVHRQRLGQRGPGADVEPLDGHLDDDDLRLALALRGGLHDGIVNADLRQARVDLAQDRLLPGRAPRLGDLHQAAVRVGQVSRKFVQHRVGAPDEHTAVPVVPAGFDVAVGGGLIGLLFERQHLVRAAEAPDRLTAVDITQARVAVRGDDAERDQRVGNLTRDVEGGLDLRLEHVDRLDHVIRGNDGEDGVLVALVQDGGGKADCVGRVAALGLAEQVLLGQLGEVLQHLRAVRGGRADEDALRGQHAAQALVAELK
jgi:hypothetical protein